MPESPLDPVYAVRTFAASVASITRTIPGFFADPVHRDAARKNASCPYGNMGRKPLRILLNTSSERGLPRQCRYRNPPHQRLL
jgi:hypothetical protein